MIKIEINLNDLNKTIEQLEKLYNGTQDMTPAMRDVSQTMKSAVLQNFLSGGRPKWLGVKRGGKPLLDTGRLMRSIVSDYDDHSAVVGTNMIYAPIHHFGGKAGRNHRVKISARPFLSLAAEDEEDVFEDLQDYFRKLIK